MGYYGDCRDCIHKNSIHRASNDYDCEFICGYSKKELDDAYGDYPCSCFVDSDAVEAEERREQNRRGRDTEALVAGYLLADHVDDIVPGSLFLGAVVIVLGLWEKLTISEEPIAIFIKGLISLYILYKLLFKWVFKFIVYVGKKIWGNSFYEKAKTFCSTIITSIVVTWIFTSVYNISYFFTCFVIFTCIIQRYFIKDWLKWFHDKLHNITTN